MTLTEVATVSKKKVTETFSRGRWTIDFGGPIELFDRPNGAYLSVYGEGKTRTEARKDLAEQLKGKTIVLDAITVNRCELPLPQTITPKL